MLFVRILATALILRSSIEEQRPPKKMSVQVLKPKKCEVKSKAQDYISINYIVRLENGTYVGSFTDKRKPYSFELNSKQSPAWSSALLGMCVGEVRRLTLPPEKAYGESGYLDKIPPNTTVLFDVELLSINEWETFSDADVNEDLKISREEMRYLAIRGLLKTKSPRESFIYGDEDPEDGEPEKKAEYFFNSADKNDDGFLDKEEYTKGMLHLEL